MKPEPIPQSHGRCSLSCEDQASHGSRGDLLGIRVKARFGSDYIHLKCREERAEEVDFFVVIVSGATS